LLLRGIYSTLRLLPAYQLVRDLRRNKLINARVIFRIHSAAHEQPTFTEAPLRQQFTAVRAGELSVQLSLQYRRDCRFHEVCGSPFLGSVIAALLALAVACVGVLLCVCLQMLALLHV
jgi:hypothetical protein